MLDTGNVELQKIAIKPQGRSLEIPRVMGVSNPNFLKESKKSTEVELSQRAQSKKTAMGGGFDIIFLDYTTMGTLFHNLRVHSKYVLPENYPPPSTVVFLFEAPITLGRVAQRLIKLTQD